MINNCNYNLKKNLSIGIMILDRDNYGNITG